MGSRWRDGLASQLQRLERGDVTLVALLVASTEQQVTDAAAACALFPQIEGLECRPVPCMGRRRPQGCIPFSRGRSIYSTHRNTFLPSDPRGVGRYTPPQAALFLRRWG
jgi:hypothetical protein